MAELEKLGQKYKVALRIIKDPRFERLPCMHQGTYADDCLVQRVTQVSWIFFLKNYSSHGTVAAFCTPVLKSLEKVLLFYSCPITCLKLKIILKCFFQHKCYIVATCDKDLKRRIRKIPGVPIMYISQHRYVKIFSPWRFYFHHLPFKDYQSICLISKPVIILQIYYRENAGCIWSS